MDDIEFSIPLNSTYIIIASLAYKRASVCVVVHGARVCACMRVCVKFVAFGCVVSISLYSEIRNGLCVNHKRKNNN